MQTKQGRQALRDGDAILYQPGEWHRHRPLPSVGWSNVWINFNHASTFETVAKNASVTLIFVGTRTAKGDAISAYYDAGKGYVSLGSVDYDLGSGETVQFALNTGLYGNTASVSKSSATYSDFWTLELPNW